MPKALAAAALLTALAGCSNAPDKPSDAASGTKLTISVVADEGAAAREMSLECDPTGGDHPQGDEACRQIAAAGAKVFEPVPADQACTMIFGGPQTATIVGTYDSEPVDATFSRSNGCEIERWEKLGTTVFDLPLQ